MTRAEARYTNPTCICARRTGSMVSRSTLTAAMIDSRDFLAARRRADTEVLLPKGPKIALSGGLALFAVAFLHERLAWREWLGVAMVAGGVLLMAIKR